MVGPAGFETVWRFKSADWCPNSRVFEGVRSEAFRVEATAGDYDALLQTVMRRVDVV
jgi:hypothetical protein